MDTASNMPERWLATLRRCGITYEDRVYKSEEGIPPLPVLVEHARSILLSLDHIVPGTWEDQYVSPSYLPETLELCS
jgi:hypothetical protein